MFPYLLSKRRFQKGSYIIWIALMFPVLVGMLGFSVDVGMIYNDKQQAQSDADALALEGMNVVRRVFNSLTPKQKADAVMLAIHDMASQTLQIPSGDITLTYCPKGTEMTAAEFAGSGRCVVLPVSGTPPSSYARVSSPSNFYPEDIGGVYEEDAAYVHVAVTKNPNIYFAHFLNIINLPPVAARSMSRVMEQLGCFGYYQPEVAKNDPKHISLNDGSNLTVLNGGILILDDENNSLHSSGQGNSISAPWIKSTGDNTSPGIEYNCLIDCPELGVNPATLPENLDDPQKPVLPVGNCNDADLIDTSSPCDVYPPTGSRGYVYVNCVINNTNVSSITLRPGTYCGGLEVNSVGSGINPITLFEPSVSGGNIVDDVYYFKEGFTLGKNGKKEVRYGYLTVNGSYIKADDNGVEGGGVYLITDENIANNGASVTLTNSVLSGSLRLWANHLVLNNSDLTYSVYSAGNNGCGSTTTRFLASLVQ